MKVSVRARLMAGISLVGATAIAIAPTTAAPHEPPYPRTSAVHLTAQTRPFVDRTEAITAPGPTAAITAPARLTASLAAFPDLANAIIATYNTIEPWVAYGVSLAQYAVGWIPGVGLLAPQIGIFYNLGESIVQSAVFNVADVIGGQAFIPALTDFVNESFAAFVNFVNAEIAWALSFLPPLPPWPFAAPEPSTEVATASIAALEPQPEPEVTEKAATTEIPEPVEETEKTGEAATEETETVTKEIEDVDDVEESKKTTTSSTETVSAQGEVRATGLNASPDEPTDGPASTDTGDADEPDVSTQSEPENDKVSEPSPDSDDGSGSHKQVNSPDSGGATAPGRAAASPAQ